MAPQDTPNSTSKKPGIPLALKIGIPVVVLALLGFAGWYFIIREETVAAKENSAEAAAECGDVRPDSFDGSWTIATACDNEALLRITEEFANGVKDYEAVGSMQDITGTMEISGTEITEGSFEVDLSTLTFIDTGSPVPSSGRANAMQNKGLEISTFPTASLTLTEPIDFGEVPAEGAEVPLTAEAELTLHGETKPVTLSLEALLTGNTIQVTASAVDVVLAEYGMEKPTAPFVADIADAGTFEFTIFLQPA